MFGRVPDTSTVHLGAGTVHNTRTDMYITFQSSLTMYKQPSKPADRRLCTGSTVRVYQVTVHVGRVPDTTTVHLGAGTVHNTLTPMYITFQSSLTMYKQPSKLLTGACALAVL